MSEEKITPVDLGEFTKQFNEAMAEVEKESEDYWNSLSKEHQLAAFCAVSRRIYQAEIVDQGTYRHALYGVFGFGPESYAPAQLAGYLTIHNAIYDEDHDERLLAAFASENGIESPEEAVKEFLYGNRKSV